MNPEETRAAIKGISNRHRLERSTTTDTDSSSNTAYQSNDIPIFLSFSKPIFPAQQEFIRNLSDGLKAFGMRPRTLGVTVYDTGVPLTAIKTLMSQSAGLIGVAFRRTWIESGEKYDTSDGRSARMEGIREKWLTSPWSHIEVNLAPPVPTVSHVQQAGMAFQIDLPLLILRESGVIADGILERGSSAFYLPTFDLETSAYSYLASEEWQHIFHKWSQQVRQYMKAKPIPLLPEETPPTWPTSPPTVSPNPPLPLALSLYGRPPSHPGQPQVQTRARSKSPPGLVSGASETHSRLKPERSTSQSNARVAPRQSRPPHSIPDVKATTSQWKLPSRSQAPDSNIKFPVSRSAIQSSITQLASDDINLADPKWKPILDYFIDTGLTKDDLEKNAGFIKDYIVKNQRRGVPALYDTAIPTGRGQALQGPDSSSAGPRSASSQGEPSSNGSTAQSVGQAIEIAKRRREDRERSFEVVRIEREDYGEEAAERRGSGEDSGHTFRRFYVPTP